MVGQNFINPVQESIQEVRVILQPGSMVEKTKWSSVLVKMSVEVMNYDMTDPDTAKAATTIQAGFKGFTARKNWLKTVQAATKIQAGFRSKQVRDILKQYKKGLDNSFTDSSDSEDEDSGHF